MKKCFNCGDIIPSTVKINGKRRSLTSRKYCLKCNPIGEKKFWRGEKSNRTKFVNGKRITNSYEFICKKCKKKLYQKTRNRVCSNCRNMDKRHENRKLAIKLSGGKCIVCGYNSCSRSLNFHHLIEENKSFTLARHWHKKWDRIIHNLYIYKEQKKF